MSMSMSTSKRRSAPTIGLHLEARFGAVTMTDVLLSERITPRERHIAKLDNDCYYVEFVEQGKMNVLQAGQSLLTHPGVDIFGFRGL